MSDKTDPTLTRGQANLMANQAGQITAQQKDWLKRDMRIARNRYRQLMIVSGIVALVVMIILMVIPFTAIPPIFSVFTWAILITGWYVYAWYQHKPIREDIARGEVQSVTGYIDKNKAQGYYVNIAGVDYSTPPEMYDAFSDTDHYIVYVLPDSKIVLSAETSPENYDDYEYEQNR